MRSGSGPQIDVVKREDKEGKLQAFISGSVIEVTAANGATVSVIAGTLVARSPSSPVFRALRALRQRQPDLTSALRVALASMDGADETIMAALPQLCAEVRVITDTRLHDAHEQLVLGPRTSWTGDCMRRDPDKRDAFECYAHDCEETARWAVLAFERLWRSSRPQLAPCVAAAAASMPSDAAAAALHERPSGDDPVSPTEPRRH